MCINTYVYVLINPVRNEHIYSIKYALTHTLTRLHIVRSHAVGLHAVKHAT